MRAECPGPVVSNQAILRASRATKLATVRAAGWEQMGPLRSNMWRHPDRPGLFSLAAAFITTYRDAERATPTP